MSGEPLYMDVYRDVVKNIRSGVWAENVPLPAERTLCQMYRVSRTTVRRALDRLERDNFIVKKHGNGNFVKPQVFEQPLVQFYSFTDTLKNAGIIIKNIIVDYEVGHLPASALVDNPAQTGALFHKLTRLRSARDYSLMLETTYLPKNRFFHLDIEWLKDHPLYEYLNSQYNMHVERGAEVFYPIVPSTKERLLLNIPANLPCMAIERFSYESDGLIEYTKSIVRGDKYKFKVELASGAQGAAGAEPAQGGVI